MDKLEKYANGWSKAEMDAFNIVMADPAMPDYKSPDYDDWLFHRAWQVALAAAPTSPELGRDSSRAIELLNELSPESQVEVLDYIRTMFPATPPAQEQAELPKLVVYKSTSIPEEQWRNEPIDCWLREMLEECDYHDGLVIKATLAFLEGLKRPADDNLRKAAEEVVKIWDGKGRTDMYGRAIKNLRSALDE